MLPSTRASVHFIRPWHTMGAAQPPFQTAQGLLVQPLRNQPHISLQSATRTQQAACVAMFRHIAIDMSGPPTTLVSATADLSQDIRRQRAAGRPMQLLHAVCPHIAAAAAHDIACNRQPMWPCQHHLIHGGVGPCMFCRVLVGSHATQCRQQGQTPSTLVP